MSYSVSTPRRFDFQPKVFGLTLRQLVYIGLGASVGALVMLGVEVHFLVRIGLGLIVFAPFAVVALLKFRGIGYDQALVAFIRYRLGTKERVWRRGFGECLVSSGVVKADAPVVAVDKPAVVGTFIVLVNAAVVVILALSVWYFVTDGYTELQRWLARMAW
jgi:uncharacterized membrane protein